MHLKWHFRKEPTPEFSDRPAFSAKSDHPPMGHPNLGVFLSQIEHELFQIPDKCLPYFNLLDHWQRIDLLLLKKADKGSCVVIWDRLDYLLEADKQLGDKSIYKDVSLNEKILRDLVETRNKFFLNLERTGSVSEKEMKYFLHD